MGRDTMGGTKVPTVTTRNVPGGMAWVNRARTNQLMGKIRPAFADDPAVIPTLPCVPSATNPVDPDWWFAAGVGPDERKSRERAQQLCRDCPMRWPCRDTALANDEAWGVWGGELFEYQPPGRDQGAAT